jgi:predicted nucleic acid-binding protein
LSGFLLDTNVVSMLSPSAADVPTRFQDWLERMDSEGRIFLSFVTIHEIEKGIVPLDRKGATAKAAGLRGWLSGLTTAYSDKVLGLDTNSATLSGRLEAGAIAQGHDPGMADAIVAGIAQAHGLTIVTRNTRHFLPFAVDVSSPDEVAGQSA